MRLAISLIVTVILILSFTTSLSGQDGRSIIQKYQDANEINDLTSKIQYKNISKKGRVQSRQLVQYISQSDAITDQYAFLLSFTAPNDIAGTSTLTLQNGMKDDDQWLYLPSLRTTKKISASKKSDRFMGTEMTYEDLSNYLSEPIEDYNYQLMGEEAYENNSCYKIEATPLEHTKTQYSKKTLWITKEHYVMAKTDFYSKENKLLKTFTASDIRKIANSHNHRAHKAVIQNIKTGNRTEVSYEDFVVNAGIDKGMFNKNALESL